MKLLRLLLGLLVFSALAFAFYVYISNFTGETPTQYWLQEDK